ncbi:MAG: asparagine synthase-related protein [Erythrobacter sp.]
MSGICGTLHPDGRPADRGALAGMMERLARRGPEGSGVWTEGPLALGHTLLATTPEALGEVMPFRHPPSGCVITGDIRIDNRDELLASLALDPHGRVVGDGELVMHAYLKWGADCPGRLLGDFAFAVWDAPRRRLLCARDQMGMRQLIWHHAPGRLFAFATDTDALLAHPEVPARVNEARIADYLEDLEAIDLTSTFYHDLFRLPPAHALVVEAGGLRQWRYWMPKAPSPLRLGDDQAYAEAFRAVFEQAVRSRLRAPPGKLASMLSGGMDSGSVTAVAAHLLCQTGAPPLPTFSATSAAPDCVETRTIRAAQTMAHLAPHDVAIEDFAAYAEPLLRLSQDSGEPFDGHMAMLRAVYLAAHKAGATVMLDGASGDSTLMADDMIAWRLRRGDIAGAWREAVGGQRFWGKELVPLSAFVAGARWVLVPEWLRKLRRMVGAKTSEQRRNRASAVAPALARRVDMPARRAAHARHVALRLDGRCDDRRPLVTHPYCVIARERYDRVAGPLAIEPRDPFLDRRVLAFALSLPPDQIEHDGWPKIILRRAMAGLLPDEVRWRTGKEHVGWIFEEALVNHWLAEPGQHWDAILQQYVSPERLTLVQTSRLDELAVATRICLSYLAWWMAH